MNYDKIFIDGKWVKPEGSDTIEVENPATEEIFATVPKASKKDVDRAVEAARCAFVTYNELPYETRKSYVQKICDGIEERKEELASVIRQELGSSYHFTMSGQVEQSINEMKAALKNSDKVQFKEDHGPFDVVREGVGVVAAITPWNYPLNQIQRKLTGALLAGATMVLKPSSDTPVTAFLLAEIIEASGLPKGVFNLVPGSGSAVGDYLTGHEHVDMISFTGSTKVGKSLYEQAEKTVKKISLELGGKSPNVVLEDGDMEKAVKQSMDSMTNNTGQSCSAVSRLIVPLSRKEEAEKLLKQYVTEQVKVGSPENKDKNMGPVVSKKQFDRVNDYIKTGKEEATLLIGGEQHEGNGYYINSTVFTDVDNKSKIAQEEIFGPVLVLITYNNVENAIEIANESNYGLFGAVFGNEKEAYKVAQKIRTGSVVLNGAKRNPAAPFGGYKQSGVGREIGWYGIEEYTEVKTIFKNS